MNNIVKFYSNKSGNFPYMLSRIRSFSLEEMESIHDYIQWLFPLTEPSLYNPDAPLLTSEDISALSKLPLISEVFLSVKQFMSFLSETKHIWINTTDHNHLRVTRMLHCLVLLNQTNEAKIKLDMIINMIPEEYLPQMKIPISFWEDAVAIK
jgi:hypothetical protein